MHEHLVHLICRNLQLEEAFQRQNEGRHCETSLMSLLAALQYKTFTETQRRQSAHYNYGQNVLLGENPWFALISKTIMTILS